MTTAVPDAWPDLTDLQGVTPISYTQANVLLNARVIKRREAIDDLDRAQRAEADSERDYRKGKLEAWGRAPDGPAAYRTAWVDAEVADYRRSRDINKARVKTAQARIASSRTNRSTSCGAGTGPSSSTPQEEPEDEHELPSE